MVCFANNFPLSYYYDLSIDLIEIYAYGMSKDLVSEKKWLNVTI